MSKLIWIMIAALAVLIGLWMYGERSSPAPDHGEVTAFVYSHSGSSVDEMYSYEIRADEESSETVVRYEFNNGNETYALPVNGELMQGLTAIIDSHNLLSWDGFD